MKKSITVKSKRLILTCMCEDEIRQIIDESADADLKEAYREMLDGALKNEKQWQWYAPWKICLRSDGTVVGELGFKGEPKEHAVEIGYGLKSSDYEGNGYMAEAVKAVMDWAYSCGEEVYFIEAETAPDNQKSQNLLLSLGFEPDGEGEEGPKFVHMIEQTNYVGIYMSLGMCFGVSLGVTFNQLALGISLGMLIGIAIGSSLHAKMKKRFEEAKEKRGA